MSRKVKYFVVPEGKDRGILRNRLSDAIEKKQTFERHDPGIKVHVFKAERIEVNQDES